MTKATNGSGLSGPAGALGLLLVAACCLGPAGTARAGEFDGGKPCGTAHLRSLVDVPVNPYMGPVKKARGFPEVGDKRDFWTYDLSGMPPKNVTIPATCRGVGEKSAIWVADDQWESEVTQAGIEKMLATLEETTPAYADRGIIENNETLFGPPPHFAEGDPDLSILVYGIAGYKNYEFDGFFRREDLDPFNEMCKTNPMLYCSNELGMVHVNSEDVASDYMLGVIAHEYQHLAHFGSDPFEASWMDESMAELAMAFNGYEDPYNLKAYTDNPALPLIIEPPVHYGACMMFGSYLYQRLHAEGIRQLVANTQQGLPALEAGLPVDTTVDSLFGEWAAANILDDPSLGDGRYGYDLFDFPAFVTKPIGGKADIGFNVPASAGYYVLANWQLEGTETYQFTYDAGTSQARAHVVVPSVPEVLPLEPGVPLAIPLYDSFDGMVLTFGNATTKSQAVSLLVEVVEGEPPVVVEPLVEPAVEEAGSDIVAQPDAAADDMVAASDIPAYEPDAASDVLAAPDVTEDNGGGKSSGCGMAGHTRGPWALLVLVVLLLALPARRCALRMRS